MDSWKISKTDSSYRFMSRWAPTVDLHFSTFCSYYRSVTWTIIRVFGMGMVIPSMIYFLLACYGKVLPSHPFGPLMALQIAILFFGIISCMACAAGILFGTLYILYELIKYGIEKIQDLREPRLKDSSPNVVLTWIKTKKNKFCPLIEIIED